MFNSAERLRDGRLGGALRPRLTLAEPAGCRADSSVTEIAEAEKISKSYVSRILRLALLAPDIVEAILGGWADQRVVLERLERPLPAGWEEQRRHLKPAAQ